MRFLYWLGRGIGRLFNFFFELTGIAFRNLVQGLTGTAGGRKLLLGVIAIAFFLTAPEVVMAFLPSVLVVLGLGWILKSMTQNLLGSGKKKKKKR